MNYGHWLCHDVLDFKQSSMLRDATWSRWCHANIAVCDIYAPQSCQFCCLHMGCSTSSLGVWEIYRCAVNMEWCRQMQDIYIYIFPNAVTFNSYHARFCRKNAYGKVQHLCYGDECWQGPASGYCHNLLIAIVCMVTMYLRMGETMEN